MNTIHLCKCGYATGTHRDRCCKCRKPFNPLFPNMKTEKPFHPLEKSPLLKGVEALRWKNFKDDVHGETRAEYCQRRMLRTLLLAYAKHGPVDDIVGWKALADDMHSTICEAIGDDAYCKWMEKISEDGKDAEVES